MRSSAASALVFVGLASLLLLYSNSTSISQYQSSHPHADSSAPSQIDELKRLLAVQQKQLDSLAPLMGVQTQAATSTVERRATKPAPPAVDTAETNEAPPAEAFSPTMAPVTSPTMPPAVSPTKPPAVATAAAKEPPPAEASLPTMAPVTSPTMPPAVRPTKPPVARSTAATASKMVATTTTVVTTKGWLGRWKPEFVATSSNIK